MCKQGLQIEEVLKIRNQGKDIKNLDRVYNTGKRLQIGAEQC